LSAPSASCPISLAAATISHENDDIRASASSEPSSLIARWFQRSSIVDPYHLVWSPGFFRTTVTAASLMMLARYVPAMSASNIIPAVSWKPFNLVNTVLHNVGLPLLASACCLLQLGLNVLSIGCAGFNTYLGPLRPYFMAILMVLSLQNALSMNTFWSSRIILTMLTRWSVALLPEGLFLWNKYFVERSLTNDDLSANTLYADVELDVPTMGCVACINSIDTALQRMMGVRHAAASLHTHKKGGMVAVQVVAASDAQVKELVSELCSVVGKAGFAGCVAKVVETSPMKEVTSIAVGDGSNDK
jgi:copper chaperone CopZ